MSILNKKNKDQADNYLPGGKQKHERERGNLFSKILGGFSGQKKETQKSFKQEKGQLEDYKGVVAREKNSKNIASSQPVSQMFAKNISASKGLPSQFSPTSLSQKPTAASTPTPTPKSKAKPKAPVIGERWRAPKILKTNLIKGEITTFIDWKKNLISLAVSLLISFSIIAFGFVGLLFWENNANQQGATLDDELINVNREIMLAEKEAIAIDVFQKKLMIAKDLLDRHRYWTNFFNFLEESLLKKVYITSDLSLSFGPKFTFDCRTDSFSTLADQIRVLRSNARIAESIIEGGQISIGVDEDGRVQNIVEFSMDITIDSDIFYK